MGLLNGITHWLHGKRYSTADLMQKYTRTTFLGRPNRFALIDSPVELGIETRKEIVKLFRRKATTTDHLQNTLSFISTTLTVFLGLLFFTNLSAYGKVVSYYWSSNQSNTVAEATVLDEEQHTLKTLPSIGVVTSTSNSSQEQTSMSITEAGPVITIRKASTPNMQIPVLPPDNRIVIPRIGQNIPINDISAKNLIAEKWHDLEDDIQKGLQTGVVHYPGTANPGQKGNVFITGHSSYYLWDPGKYKDVFALLHNVEIGDQIIVYYNQNKFTYKVEEKKVVSPKDVDVLKQTDEKKITLMTCTPVGTALNRLIIVAKQVE